MSLDYEIDGVVYRARPRRPSRSGWGGPRTIPATHWPSSFRATPARPRLLDVEWGVSRTGTITPMAILDPIELSGAMIGRAGLSNLTRFQQSWRLTRGATRSEVTRRGGVIPYIEKVVVRRSEGAFCDPHRMPGLCVRPVKVRQKRDGEFLQCERPEQCVTARLRELEHFAKVVDIQGFGPKIVNAVVEGPGLLTTPADYYRLTHDELTSLERLAAKSAQNSPRSHRRQAHDARCPPSWRRWASTTWGPANARLLAQQLLDASTRVRAVNQEALGRDQGDQRSDRRRVGRRASPPGPSGSTICCARSPCSTPSRRPPPAEGEDAGTARGALVRLHRNPGGLRPQDGAGSRPRARRRDPQWGEQDA